MRMRYLEDFEVGEAWESSPTPLTAEEIVDFGLKFDPQPMHIDANAAEASAFGGLVASGLHVLALSMRLFVQAGGHGRTPVVGLGLDELRWLQPVRAGDRLTARREVVEVRRSSSDARFGVVRTRVTMRNQNGKTVMTCVSAGRVPARPQQPEMTP
jgi:acyl dehydratase